MAPRKLSPALLATLGLSACVDGCDPSDLPLVGSLFDDRPDDEGDSVHPCLKVVPPRVPVPQVPVGPCLEAPMVDTGPCLEIAPPVPVVAPIHVGPCLKVARPLNPPNAPRPAAPGTQTGQIAPSRPDVLASLVDEGVLAPDVLLRLGR